MSISTFVTNTPPAFIRDPAFNGDPAFIRTIGKYPPAFIGDTAFIRSFTVALLNNRLQPIFVRFRQKTPPCRCSIC